MSDPFNCPTCGAHDYGLYSVIGCPHCLRAERDRLAAERDALKIQAAVAVREKNEALADRDRLARECNVHALNCAHLRAELSAARAPAERYRWLKHEGLPHLCIAANGVPTYVLNPLGSDFDVDAAIDAARATDSASVAPEPKCPKCGMLQSECDAQREYDERIPPVI